MFYGKSFPIGNTISIHDTDQNMFENSFRQMHKKGPFFTDSIKTAPSPAINICLSYLTFSPITNCQPVHTASTLFRGISVHSAISSGVFPLRNIFKIISLCPCFIPFSIPALMPSAFPSAFASFSQSHIALHMLYLPAS